jgi:hypothetical protein
MAHVHSVVILHNNATTMIYDNICSIKRSCSACSSALLLCVLLRPAYVQHRQHAKQHDVIPSGSRIQTKVIVSLADTELASNTVSCCVKSNLKSKFCLLWCFYSSCPPCYVNTSNIGARYHTNWYTITPWYTPPLTPCYSYLLQYYTSLMFCLLYATIGSLHLQHFHSRCYPDTDCTTA